MPAPASAATQEVHVVSSKALVVDDYLDSLPEDRRAVVEAVRRVILQHLPAGYQETMNWGMISYEVPLARYPGTYNGQPLSYAGLAAQKNHYALYLMTVYMDPALDAKLRDAFAATGRRLDMGKSCLRFKRAEDLPLETIGEIVAAVPPGDFIIRCEAARHR